MLLTRTPYDKRGAENNARILASSGYIAVAQDVRGRYESAGEYWWWENGPSVRALDGQNGFDTVEWAARLPGSDGRVGTWGISAQAESIWRLADRTPPRLKAIFAVGMAVHSTDRNFGVFATGRRLQWAYGMVAEARHRAGSQFAPTTIDESDIMWHEFELGK